MISKFPLLHGVVALSSITEVRLTKDDIDLISNNVITDKRHYIYDASVKNGKILSEYLKCLLLKQVFIDSATRDYIQLALIREELNYLQCFLIESQASVSPSSPALLQSKQAPFKSLNLYLTFPLLR